MGLNGSMGLGFVFSARDLASAKMQRVERQFASLDDRVGLGAERMTASFKQLGLGLAVFTAGALALVGSLSLADAAGKFEQGLAAVGAVTRATTREMDMLRDAAIEAGIKTQFSPTEAVEGLTSLATAGQTATQATRTLIPVLDLAAGSLGQLGVAGSAEAVVGTLNAYGLEAEQAAGVTDKLLRITQLTNFQARDFEAGLAKAAASGSVFRQSLDDVLITMGLLRNRNIDASSSATAFREATRRVGAETRAQNALQSAGVKIFDDATGQMRSIVDIMVDVARVTDGMTDAERNRRVVVAFGARGLLAFNAILNAAFTTTRDGQQVTLKGAEAIAALRNEMAGASGTAAQFREKLLDTFQGQKTLLKGTLQTLAVVLGAPFAKVFKPIVAAVTDALNAVIRVFQAIPAPIRKALAGVILAAAGFLMLVGGVIAAKATIVLLGFALKALGISLGGILATLGPAILIVVLLAAAVAALYIAFRQNLGGIADMAREMWDRVSLFFKALKQLFEQGGFSGAVRDELARAENQGLKRFLISVWQIVYRIGQVWEGFKQGFAATVEASRPIFEELASAFSALGDEIGALFSSITGSAAGLPSEDFRSFGQVVGSALATIVRWGAAVVAVFARIAGGIVSGFRSMMKYIGPAIDAVASALGVLRDAWNRLTGATDASSDGAGRSSSAWRSLGQFLGQTLGVVITGISYVLAALVRIIAGAITAVKWLVDAFVTLGTWVAQVAQGIYHWFVETLPNAIAGAVAAVKGFFVSIGQFFLGIGQWFSRLFSSIADAIKSFFSPVVDFFTGISRTIRRAINKLWEFVLGIIDRIPDALLPSSLEKLKKSRQVGVSESIDAGLKQLSAPAKPAPDSGAAAPAVADAGSRAQGLDRLESSLLAATKGQGGEPGQRGPLVVNVQVDGETIARASHNAANDLASRTYSPVPAY